LVSHDRHFLDEICTSILEIEDGRVNYIKAITPNIRNSNRGRRERKEFEYWQYIGEKERLLQLLKKDKNKKHAEDTKTHGELLKQGFIKWLVRMLKKILTSK